MNETIRKFGWPDSLLTEFDHWVVLLRRAQPTAGALILAAKSSALAFGELPPGAHAELEPITRMIERALKEVVDYQRINYLMLMMVDPHVHFHVFPRYQGSRAIAGLDIADGGWPGPPDLKSAIALDPEQIADAAAEIAGTWRSAQTNTG